MALLRTVETHCLLTVHVLDGSALPFDDLEPHKQSLSLVQKLQRDVSDLAIPGWNSGA